MPSYTTSLGLILPNTGEFPSTWGTQVNSYLTQYLDSSVAGTQTISGSQTAVTLTVTNGATLTQAGAAVTGSAQFQIINCTGNPAGLLTITAPASSRQYIVLNSTSTNQSVKIVGAGPTTGVTLVAGEKAHVAWNGSDFVKVANLGGDGSFGNLSYTGTLTGGTGVVNIGSGQFYKDASGNVGIGTTSPAEQLTAGNANDRVGLYKSGTTTQIRLGSSIAGTAMMVLQYNRTTGAYQFSEGTNGNTGSPDIAVDAAGNVGIGTTSPSAKLEVNGLIIGTSTAAQTRGIRVAATAGYVSNLSFFRSGYAEWFIGSRNNSDALDISITDDTHATPAMTITSAQRFGLGGSALGTARLTVNGPQGDVQIRADDGNVTTYVAYSSGTGATAVNFFGTQSNHAQCFITNNVERGRFTAAGDFITNVNGTAPTLGTNSTMSFELTSNTSLKIVVRGTDGVTRSATLTLS